MLFRSRVIIPPQSVKQVVKKMETLNKPFVDINDPEIKEIIIEKIEDIKKKPLKGKRIKSSIRSKLKKSKVNS